MPRLLVFAWLALNLTASAKATGDVIGWVVDARGGEVLARVEILPGSGPLDAGDCCPRGPLTPPPVREPILRP